MNFFGNLSLGKKTVFGLCSSIGNSYSIINNNIYKLFKAA
jgi:hypothetical protein